VEFKSEAQARRAIIEDLLVDFIYKGFPESVMHGGTAVWRCYGGNRFSRDVDFYANASPKEESEFQKRLHNEIVKTGYSIIEEKYNNKTLTLHMIVRGNGTTGKIDITFDKRKGTAVEYDRVDGTKRVIYALTPEEILREKISAYNDKLGRDSHEIHDIYDILLLKDRIKNVDKKLVDELRRFLLNVSKNPPRNEKELQNLILTGVAPGFADIVRMLNGWLDENNR